MADPVKLSKSRIFNPFDEKLEFSTVNSSFSYRAERFGPNRAQAETQTIV